MNNRLVVIDALNMYLRNYVCNPSLSYNGDPIGGLKGFLYSLQKIIREIKPSHVCIAWDGPEGSTKRKKINKNYKAARKPIRLNRSIKILDENQELANKVWQQTRLVEYLNNLPAIQVMIPRIEADDIISYVVKMPRFKEWQKIIVSADKDFLQCCDNKSILFRPTQSQIHTVSTVLEEFNIHPNNFAVARAIVGDTSDNLPGVSGIGLKTAAKKLPFLGGERSYLLDEVFEFCEENSSNSRVYGSILEEKARVSQNYRIMQLDSPSISATAAQKINESFSEFDFHFNKTEIKKMILQDGFGEVNFEEMYTFFKKVAADGRKQLDS